MLFLRKTSTDFFYFLALSEILLEHWLVDSQWLYKDICEFGRLGANKVLYDETCGQNLRKGSSAWKYAEEKQKLKESEKGIETGKKPKF